MLNRRFFCKKICIIYLLTCVIVVEGPFQYYQNDNVLRNGFRIINGTHAQEGKWRFVAAVLSGGRLICGGSIVNDDTVVTAAHCIDPSGNQFLSVYLGHVNIGSIRSEFDYKVIQAIQHEKYDKTISANDIAVLKLERKIDFAKYHGRIARVCLPVDETQEIDFNECMTMGWGLTESGSTSNILNQVQVPILNDSVCASCSGVFNKNYMLCAGYLQGGKDSCQGDSGGPLVCPLKADNTVYTLRGVVSFGNGCARPNNPGYYARVASFTSWIQSKAET